MTTTPNQKLGKLYLVMLAIVTLATIFLASMACADEAVSAAPSLLTSTAPAENVSEPVASKAAGNDLAGTPFESQSCPCGPDCNCNAELLADIVESLRFLYGRQEDILERLAKVESAMIRVETATGQIVTRPVAMQGGSGSFVLGPGERLSGYQDVITGQWVSAIPSNSMATTSPAVVRSVSYSQPIQPSVSQPALQTTFIESRPVSGGRTAGRITARMPIARRVTFGNCCN